MLSLTTRGALFLAALSIAGCGGDDARGYATFSSEESAAGAAADAVYARDVPQSAPAPSPVVVPGQSGAPARPRMLIRTGHATLEVEALDSAVLAVRRLAESAGGYVSNVAITGGRDQTRRASLTLRIPATRFDETLAGLDSLGEVESVHFDSQDVGEQYADLEIRLSNARRLEQRLLDLLANRTGSLEDVLAVERELARVREQIESMDASLRGLRDRVDMSSISIMMHEPEPLFSTGPGDDVLARSFRQAGRNFVGLVAGFIASLGVLLPLALLFAFFWWLWRRRRRRRGHATDLD